MNEKELLLKNPLELDKEAEKYLANHVKVTLQLSEKERKAWKQYALNNDITLTEAIKKAMRELIEKQ